MRAGAALHRVPRHTDRRDPVRRAPRDATDTAARSAEDLAADALPDPDPRLADPAAVLAWLRDRAPDLVTWAGWEAIDAQESSLGEAAGRPRVKLVRLEELLRTGRA